MESARKPRHLVRRWARVAPLVLVFTGWGCAEEPGAPSSTAGPPAPSAPADAAAPAADAAAPTDASTPPDAPGTPPAACATSFLDPDKYLGGLDDPGWYKQNVPLLDVPDSAAGSRIQAVYYYRWSTLKRSARWRAVDHPG